MFYVILQEEGLNNGFNVTVYFNEILIFTKRRAKAQDLIDLKDSFLDAIEELDWGIKELRGGAVATPIVPKPAAARETNAADDEDEVVNEHSSGMRP